MQGLPPLGESRSYELRAFLGASRFAVSVEPGGGGPVPTGDVVLMGEVPSG